MNAKALNLPNMLSLVRVFLAPIVLLFLSVRIGGTVPLRCTSPSFSPILCIMTDMSVSAARSRLADVIDIFYIATRQY